MQIRGRVFHFCWSFPSCLSWARGEERFAPHTVTLMQPRKLGTSEWRQALSGVLGKFGTLLSLCGSPSQQGSVLHRAVTGKALTHPPEFPEPPFPRHVRGTEGAAGNQDPGHPGAFC